MSSNMDFLTKNLEIINQKIRNSCAASQREIADVRLIWVSKTKSKELVDAAIIAGAKDFGENRVQEALEKFSPAPKETNLHIIGPIQNNKMRKAVQVANWIHTLDSYEKLDRLNNICAQEGKTLNVLFQINTSGEDTKNGIPLLDASNFLKSVPTLSNLLYCGLMTIGKNTVDIEECRNEFRQLRNLRDDFFNLDTRFTSFRELSMGMSHDMEIAIEEGATMIRVGSALFGNR
jgi:PLP dependent protein